MRDLLLAWIPYALCTQCQMTVEETKATVQNCQGGVLDVSFSTNPIVQELRLNGNGLESLPNNAFDSLPNLEVLDLHDNDLASLPGSIFAKLTKLKKLHLNGNNLTFFSSGMFSQLSSLDVLDLSFNRFTGLPCAVLTIPQLLNFQEATHLHLKLLGNDFSELHLPNRLCNSTDLSPNVIRVCSEIYRCSVLGRRCIWRPNEWDIAFPCKTKDNCGTGWQIWKQQDTLEKNIDWKECVGEIRICNLACPADCKLSDWSQWDSCTKMCGNGTQSRRRTVEQEPLHRDDPCGELEETQQCNVDPCPTSCVWSVWSSWSGACNGDCGLPTAKQFRYRYVVQPRLHDGAECAGESVQSANCNFSVCNRTMYCEGSLLTGNLTKELFKDRRRECRAQCNTKCTREDLCGDAPTQRGKVWIDSNWTRRWFGTTLSKFMAEVALGDSFEYPSLAYEPCMWLLPTCTNATDCDFGTPFKKSTIAYTMDNFYQWFFSDGEISARSKPVGDRKTFRVGGQAMRNEDSGDRGHCVERCKSWCFESCSCNWGWDFSWSNERDLGWKYDMPMRYRWIPNVQRKQSYGTWTCMSAEGEPLRTPWDNPAWSLDVYSNAIKDRVNAAPLQFNLVCDHVKRYYGLQVCGRNVKCNLDCTKAAQPVVDFLYAEKMLQPMYMKKGGKKHRAELVHRLHQDIHKNCRRTCAEAHVPAFLHLYPIY